MHQLKLNIELDENQIPETMSWEGADQQKKDQIRPIKAFFLNTWDDQERVTASLNLWTKTMTTQEMKAFFHQSLVAMVESFEKAVPDQDQIVKDLYATCNYLAEKMELITPDQVEDLIQKSKNQAQLGQEDLDLKSLIP